MRWYRNGGHEDGCLFGHYRMISILDILTRCEHSLKFTYPKLNRWPHPGAKQLYGSRPCARVKPILVMSVIARVAWQLFPSRKRTRMNIKMCSPTDLDLCLMLTLVR